MNQQSLWARAHRQEATQAAPSGSSLVLLVVLLVVLADGTRHKPRHWGRTELTPERLACLGASNEMQAQLRSKIQEEIAAAEKRKESESLVAGGGGSVPSYAAADRKPQQWRQAAHSSRAPASVEGLSVRRGDDLIGVKGADIFDMVHRKYQEERKRTDFLE